MKSRVKIWAPATVANLGVGFDALGCALEQPGEVLVMRRTEQKGRVSIAAIHGAQLDLRTEHNVAGLAAQSVLSALGNPCGIEMELHKSIHPGSGIGSSAASAAGAAAGVNALLDAGLRPDELIPFALDGEALASGARHPDNVAPALLGGLVLCPPEGPLRPIPFPTEWHLVVLHPQVTVRTSDARAVLPVAVPLTSAAQQGAWFASFVAACYENDAERAVYALEDQLVGPHRESLIPGFNDVRDAALQSGARGGGISGSGPSTFWVALNRADAEQIGQAVKSKMNELGVDSKVYITQIAARGAHEMP